MNFHKMNNLDYGIIGNCRSSALISNYGSIDWLCLPHFDSSSVFASILDENRGGSLRIIVDEQYTFGQWYVKNTNILVTRFTSGDNCFEVLDFMPRYRTIDQVLYNPPDVIRYIRYRSGKPIFKIGYDPKLEYGVYTTYTDIENNYIKSYTRRGPYDSIYLYSDLDLNKILRSETIELSEDCFILLSYHQKILPQTLERAYLKLQRTEVYWLNWSEKTTKYVKYGGEISRSSLVLKLLSYDNTGAVLAAATTSLPETIGEERNWDYRFCWIRDSSMVVNVMSNLGHHNMAQRFIRFLLNQISDKDEKIQIMYGIDGESRLHEKILGHLDGYEGSKPVRIGNDAYRQKQNDIYGILMDVIYQQFNLFKNTLQDSEALWTMVRNIVNTVERNWHKPDRGIWEIRNENKHFTFSKVLCWVALDRAVKVAGLIGMADVVPQWVKLKDKIMDDVMKNAWNEKLNSFVQFYGSDEVDAANLLMEPLGFIEAGDVRYKTTVQATGQRLLRNGLMYRYRNFDDFGEPSSSFTICTFWYITALYKTGEKGKAREMFSQLLSYSNHVGLFSEDIDFETKRLLGNFPQAYSHLALIETAIILQGGEITEEETILEVLG
jgi:alpha,alpha-trehalase